MTPTTTDKQDRQRLEREIEQLRQELHAEKEDRIRRDTELESLRKFANAHDKSHGSDVTAIIETINNEASSFARDTAQNWNTDESKGTYREDNVDTLRSTIPALVQALEACNPQHRLARRLFQMAIQAYILYMAQQILEKTCFGLDDMTDGFVQELRSMIFSSESQPTFARWRAITQMQLQSIVLPEREKHILVLKETILKGLCGLGSCLTGRPLVEEDLKELREEIEISVKEVILNSIRLGDMVSTDIVSANYGCITSTGRNYNPNYMEMPHGATEATSEDVVAATVRLGIMKLEKLGREAVEGARELKTTHLKAHILTQRELSTMVSEAAISIPTAQKQVAITTPTATQYISEVQKDIHHDQQIPSGPPKVAASIGTPSQPLAASTEPPLSTTGINGTSEAAGTDIPSKADTEAQAVTARSDDAAKSQVNVQPHEKIQGISTTVPSAEIPGTGKKTLKQKWKSLKSRITSKSQRRK